LNERLSRFRSWLQWFVVKAQAHGLPGVVLRWVCRSGSSLIGRKLMAIPGVEAVYVRHTHAGSPSFVPGHSDLDLTVVLSKQAADSGGTVESVACLIEHRRLFYYYLSPSDARMTTSEELARLTRKWPPAEILVGPENWTLLAGREQRRETSKKLPASQVAWHPEFNRWWGHILQDYLLRTLPGEENRYLRVFYRGAIKQAAYFMIARGMTPPPHDSFTDQSLAQWVLDSHPQLRPLLQRLEENDFWDEEQSDTRERIFHEVLKITADFHVASAVKPRPAGKHNSNPADPNPHLAAYRALAAKLEALPELKSLLADVLVYPTPFCQPSYYQADLLLPDEISLTELTALAALIRQLFHGREIACESHLYAITLVPVSVSSAPLVRRGSPFPFLAEHIGRFGQMLFGQCPLPQQPEGKNLIEWCRVFLPYFTSNLRHRVEHSSRDLNFCHIAALRVFLETGEIVTDSACLIARHQVIFGRESPGDELWSYLLQDKPGRHNHASYLAATRCLQDELERVEQMLDERESQSAADPEGDNLR